MDSPAVELLRKEPRIFWGHVIRVLIERGWSPPKPDERIVEDLLDAMGEVGPPQVSDLPDLHLSEPSHLGILTAKEREIAVMLTLGLRNSEIALRMGCTQRTVKFHLTNIYRKLEARDRTQVVAMVLGADRDVA